MIFTILYRGRAYLINAEHLARLVLLLALRKTHRPSQHRYAMHRMKIEAAEAAGLPTENIATDM